jgi:CheY-like chemotaxis protein
MPNTNQRPAKHRILVVDDEEDIHQITQMSLKSLRYQDRRIEFLHAMSGQQAIEIMRKEPDVGVILLDVVMENDHAGLDACKAIREDIGNRFVRILLRTGQPGAAPEKTVIQEYDIDGYLPKGELTSVRLFTTVRTSLKAYCELMELERHRQHLAAIHDCVVSLVSYEPIETTLERILDTVVTICPAPLVALQLKTFDVEGNTQQYYLYRTSDPDGVAGEAAAEQLRAQVSASLENLNMDSSAPLSFHKGFLVPLRIDHELGYGWVYVEETTPDQIARHGLPLLAAHAANALYSVVTQSMLANREGDMFDQIQI